MAQSFTLSNLAKPFTDDEQPARCVCGVTEAEHDLAGCIEGFTPAELAEPLTCFCCGTVLEAGRRLMCVECADPAGTVARMARMLRR